MNRPFLLRQPNETMGQYYKRLAESPEFKEGGLFDLGKNGKKDKQNQMVQIAYSSADRYHVNIYDIASVPIDLYQGASIAKDEKEHAFVLVSLCGIENMRIYPMYLPSNKGLTDVIKKLHEESQKYQNELKEEEQAYRNKCAQMNAKTDATTTATK